MDQVKKRRPHRATTVSRVVAICSDVHFNSHHRPSWNAFRQWHRVTKPWKTILLGDVLDLHAMSSFEKSPLDPVTIVEEIETLCSEGNALREECSSLVISFGNHENRLARWLAKSGAHALKGLKGLTLPEICVAHGLREDIQWHKETAKEPGIMVGGILFKHGDKQASKFGSGVNPASAQLNRAFRSVGFGHFHRAGLSARTADGKTYFGVANPCLADGMDHMPDCPWERGFTVVELAYPDYEIGTPHVVVMQDGVFSYGGRTFGLRG